MSGRTGDLDNLYDARMLAKADAEADREIIRESASERFLFFLFFFYFYYLVPFFCPSYFLLS